MIFNLVICLIDSCADYSSTFLYISWRLTRTQEPPRSQADKRYNSASFALLIAEWSREILITEEMGSIHTLSSIMLVYSGTINLPLFALLPTTWTPLAATQSLSIPDLFIAAFACSRRLFIATVLGPCGGGHLSGRVRAKFSAEVWQSPRERDDPEDLTSIAALNSLTQQLCVRLQGRLIFSDAAGGGASILSSRTPATCRPPRHLPHSLTRAADVSLPLLLCCSMVRGQGLFLPFPNNQTYCTMPML